MNKETYVALPSLTKTQETVKFRDAETIFLDEIVILSFTGCWLGTKLAYNFIFKQALANWRLFPVLDTYTSK